jgi:16S rRNA (cytidine1402-2'-O)-methyltransferase
MVENIKVTRRYLKKLDRAVDIDSIHFYEMGKHAEDAELSKALEQLKAGQDLGVISDAGCPGVADPGSLIVHHAQMAGIPVRPLVGPSSILLTLMGSGFNGQSFSFHGYAPKDKGDRKRFLAELSQGAKHGSTQLLMDTPFRNMSLFDDILAYCPDNLRLCIAKDLTGSQESILTKRISDWSKSKPSLAKVPVMFAIGH